MRFSLVFGLFLPVWLAAQPVASPRFSLKPAKESVIFSIGAASYSTGFFLKKQVRGYSESELTALLNSRPSNWKPDFAERHFSKTAQKASDFMLVPPVLTAVSLCFSEKDSKRDLFRNATMLAETGLLTAGATLLTKSIARRNRPFIFNENAPLALKLEPDARLSFFSGHTSSTAAMSFFSASIWSAHHQNSSWKPWVWATAAIYPAVVGFLRMAGGKHHFGDVLVGYAVGAVIGWAVPRIHLTR